MILQQHLIRIWIYIGLKVIHDLLYIVLHELIHGLGFTSSWSDDANIKALTPAV